MSNEVIGQLVTPQKTLVIPTAAQRDGENPRILPKRQPKAAPVKKLGTISPPLKPAPSVSAVKIILRRKASGRTSPCIHPVMMSIPVPL